MAAMQFVVLFVSLVCYASSHYVITTPRRWTADTPTPICVQLTSGDVFGPNDAVSATLVDRIQNMTVIVPDTPLEVTQGETLVCTNLQYGYSDLDSHKAELRVTGNLDGHTVNGSANMTLAKQSGKTFVQTDKYIYKPGQKVQFRVLSAGGPELAVSNVPYSEIFVESPSRVRIFQWLAVDNTKGLVHLDFDLSDEVEEGFYTITTKGDFDTIYTSFKVEEYVLPRYEVTIKGPKVILGSDETVTVTLCAKYTFGQPVKGNASLSLSAGSYRVYANLTQTSEISGCHDFVYNTSELLFDHNNCHIRIRDLKASGHVNETGTGETIYTQSTSLRVHRKGINFNDITPEFIQKPYMPRSVKLSATFADGTPANEESVEVCGRINYNEEFLCKNFSTNQQGHLEFVLPNNLEPRVTVKSNNYKRLERYWNDVMEDSQHNIYNNNYESYKDPTNSSITIFSENDLVCTTGQDINVNLPVIYIVNNIESAVVNVQVMSRGQIRYTGTVQATFTSSELPIPKEKLLFPLVTPPAGTVTGVFNVPITLPSSSSPNVKVLVWFTTSNGSVIADSKEIDVTPCLEQSVDFSWNVEKGEPGSAAVMSIVSSAPDAICSVGVVDKSVELLSSQNGQLKISDVLDVVRNSIVARYDEDQLNLEYCLEKRNITEPTLNPEAPPRTKRSSPPFQRRYNYGDKEALHMFVNAGLHVWTNLEIETLYCEHLIVEHLKQLAEQETRPENLARPPRPQAISAFAAPVAAFGAAPVAEAALSDFDTSHKVTVAEESESERTYFPETWLWDIKVLPESGVLEETITLPDALTEWVGRTVCVSPTKGVAISNTTSITTFTPFFVDLLLPSSVVRGETLPLKMSVFNYEQGPLPVTIVLEASDDYEIVGGATEGTRSFCIPANDKSVQTIKIKPLTIGDVNITVQAVTDAAGNPGCADTAPVKLDRLVRSLPVEAEGIEREKTFTSYICAEDVAGRSAPVATWSIAPPSGIVEGSARAWVTATGDLMGPSIENLGNLVRLPTGCGEQNMLKLAPNIYIMKYLEASGQTTPELKQKIEAFSRSGYQRQLNYRRRDGSYSAFGSKDAAGSTWLTAFVVKTFSQAKNFIYIDEQSLNTSITWLTSIHDKEGCYQNNGRVINKMMKGGLGVGSDALLTAYVASALVEAGQDVSAAIPCIKNIDQSNNYALALASYTMALTKEPQAQAYVDTLLAAAATNSSDMRWDLPDNNNINSALHVETAAYALLAMITLDPVAYAEQARKTVRWLSGQRNGQGGFVSTQDTVVALQALAAFEEVQPSTTLDLKAQFTSDGSGTFRMSVMENNKFLLQSQDLPVLPQEVSFNVQGQGCGLVQAVMRYNVPAQELSDAFTLTVTNTEAKKDCKTRSLTACTAYTLADGASNMALLQFKLISGYIPIKQDLRAVVALSPTFKRYEVDGNLVTFYLEEVTATEVCATFRVHREIVMENSKPGSVTVLDYYDTSVRTTKEYTFPEVQCTQETGVE